MTFIVEPIPEDVVTDGVLSRYRAYEDRRFPISSKWVVDPERYARMALVGKEGGPYEGTQETKRYVLFWHQYVISLAADPLEETCPPSGPEMSWRVHRLQLPEALQVQQDEVLDMIRDAFRAIGYVFDGAQYAAVNVHFDLPCTGETSKVEE